MDMEAKPLVLEQEILEEPSYRGSWRATRLTAALLGAVAVVGLIGHRATALAPRTAISANPALTRLDEEEDPCKNLPYFRVTGIKSNNLGGKGPDKDAPEGIIYQGEAHIDGLNSSVEIHLHAASEAAFADPESEETVKYEPQWPKENGIKGNFGVINVRPGSNITVKLHAYDVEKEKDVELPQFALTFFDLDAGKGGDRSVEYLRVSGFNSYFVSNETEINITDEGDGSMLFTATKEGTGDDNPDEPLELSELQKNRAVSFAFADTKEVIFELGCTDGLTGRVFQFVVRPALRCAYTKLDDGSLLDADDPKNPIRIARGGAVGHSTGVLALLFALWSLA